MYFPLKCFLHPQGDALVIEQSHRMSVIVHMKEVEKELRSQLSLITNAALNCLSLRNTSPLFAKHLGFSDKESSLSMEWKWSSFEEKGLKSSLTCMIKLVQYFENYGKNRFPGLFGTPESPGSQAIQATFHILNNLVQKELSKKATSTPEPIPLPSKGTLFKKRKAQEIASTSSISINPKKQRLLAAYTPCIEEEREAKSFSAKTEHLPITTSIPLALLTTNPENILDSDEEDSLRETIPIKYSQHEISPTPLLLQTIIPQAPDLKKQKTDLLLKKSSFFSFFHIVKGCSSGLLRFYFKYTTITKPKRCRSSSLFLKLLKKNQISLKTILKTSGPIVVEWKDPLNDVASKKHLILQKDILTKALQGIMANEYYVLQDPHHIFKSARTSQLQKCFHYFKNAKKLLKRRLQHIKALPSYDLLETPLSSTTTIIPKQVMEQLVQKKLNLLTSLKTTQPCLPRFLICLFSIHYLGAATIQNIQMQYRVITRPQKYLLENICRYSLIKTLSIISSLLKNAPKKAIFINPLTNEKEKIDHPDRLWEIILDSLLETEHYLSQHCYSILHHQKSPDLARDLKKTIQIIKNLNSSFSEDRVLLHIIPKLMEQAQQTNPNLKPLSTLVSEKSQAPHSSTALEAIIDPSQPSSDCFFIPLLHVYEMKYDPIKKIQIIYSVKCNRDKQRLTRVTRNPLKGTIALVANLLKTKRILNENLFIAFTPPFSKHSQKISKTAALQIIHQGLQLTFEYHKKHQFKTFEISKRNTIKTDFDILMTDLNSFLKKAPPLPSHLSIKDDIMERLITTQKASSLQKLKKLKQIKTTSTKEFPNSPLIFNLYLFSVLHQGKRKDGSFSTWNIRYHIRQNKEIKYLYKKARQTILATIKNASYLLDLKKLPPRVTFTLPNKQPVEVASVESLYDILLEGLEETFLFFTKYAVPVLNTAHMVNPLAELEQAIEKVLDKYPFDSRPPRKTTSTILLQTMCDNLEPHICRPVLDMSAH